MEIDTSGTINGHAANVANPEGDEEFEEYEEVESVIECIPEEELT